MNREKPFRFGPFIFLVAIISCVRFGIEGCLNPRLTRLFNDGGIKVVIDVYSNDFFFFHVADGDPDEEDLCGRTLCTIDGRRR